ncbi:MAG: hypothetical protein KAY37_12975 [Phycisphaerae bacterium]|nr:hypothetical protein [Phycisphaerae bacterium]
MSIFRMKKWWAAVLVCGACTVFQFLPGGCVDYYARAAFTSIDFCSIFNCESGQYVDLCGTYPLFMDCPR